MVYRSSSAGESRRSSTCVCLSLAGLRRLAITGAGRPLARVTFARQSLMQLASDCVVRLGVGIATAPRCLQWPAWAAMALFSAAPRPISPATAFAVALYCIARQRHTAIQPISKASPITGGTGQLYVGGDVPVGQCGHDITSQPMKRRYPVTEVPTLSISAARLI
jgi:hypothetical protein